MSETEEIEVPVWAGHGTGRLVRRDCLPVDHKWSTYNYIKNKLGKKPEDYGVFKHKENDFCHECERGNNAKD